MKILIIGDARHGKDTVAEMIHDEFGLSFNSSSMKAAELIMFNLMNEYHDKDYKTVKECFEDRVNHRKLWYDEICKFNALDKSRLAKEIMKDSDIYVGMRSELEIQACIKNNIFDHIIGVYDYRKPRENKKSNTIDVFKYSEYVICNNGDLEDLKEKVSKIFYTT